MRGQGNGRGQGQGQGCRCGRGGQGKGNQQGAGRCRNDQAGTSAQTPLRRRDGSCRSAGQEDNSSGNHQ